MNGRRTLGRIFLGAAMGAALSGGLFYARRVEPERVVVEHVPLALPRLSPAFDGYRITHISDLHASSWMTPGRVLKLAELVNTQRPDLVAITGDFATYSQLRGALTHHVPKLAAPLKRLHAPDGTFAVLGNHDHKSKPNLLRQALAAGVAGEKDSRTAKVVRRTLASSGVAELRNTVHTLRRGEAVFHICGVDSAYWGMDRLDSVLDQLPEEGSAVLLAHEPDFADRSAATGRFDLQLSGHSHGGQVRIPRIGPTVLPPLGRGYPAGLYTVRDMILYTNRGLGSHPRLRLNCPPEITIITLRTGQ